MCCGSDAGAGTGTGVGVEAGAAVGSVTEPEAAIALLVPVAPVDPVASCCV